LDKARAASGRAGVALGVVSGAVRGGEPAWPGEVLGARGYGRGASPRTSIPLGDKTALIDIKDAGYTWAQILDMFRRHISLSAARNIYRNKDEYKQQAAAAEDLSAPRLRRSYFDGISQSLRDHPDQ